MGGDPDDEEQQSSGYGSSPQIGGPPGGARNKDVQFAEAETKQLQLLERTSFVLQFAWVPTVERDRLEVSPRDAEASAAAGTDAAAPVQPAQ